MQSQTPDKFKGIPYGVRRGLMISGAASGIVFVLMFSDYRAAHVFSLVAAACILGQVTSWVNEFLAKTHGYYYHYPTRSSAQFMAFGSLAVAAHWPRWTSVALLAIAGVLAVVADRENVGPVKTSGRLGESADLG